MNKRTKNKLNDVSPEEWDALCKTALTRIEGVATEGDAVNHPSHYNLRGIECIHGIEAMLTEEEFIGYLRGNSLKYRWRFPYKNGKEDLLKAEWYEKRLLGIIDKRDKNENN